MNDDNIRKLMSFPLLNGYTEHGIRRLLEHGTIRNHLAGEILFKESDPPEEVLLVIAGALEIYVTRHGRDIVVNHAAPGDLVGELAVLCHTPRSASVRAVDASVVLHWSDKSFYRLRLEDHTLEDMIFTKALRTLMEREKALIESALKGQ
jgi:CRP-like cAMP-binding protein